MNDLNFKSKFLQKKKIKFLPKNFQSYTVRVTNTADEFLKKNLPRKTMDNSKSAVDKF